MRKSNVHMLKYSLFDKTNMNLYLLITCLFFLHIAVSNCKVCTSSKGVVKCCQGYVWNQIENRCIPPRGHTECDAGTFGPKCENVCLYPYYGKICLPICNCSKDHCSPVNGCHENTINASTSSQTSQILRSSTSLLRDYSVNGITLRTNTSESKRNLNDGEKSTNLLEFLVIGLLVVLAFMFILYKGIDLNKRCSTYNK